MSEEFKSPILVTGTFTPSGTQDVNVVSPNPLPVTNTPGTVAISVVTRVASATSSHLLVAANASRKGLLFYNDGNAQQFIKFGLVASGTDFSVRLTSQSYYEAPQPIYIGQIDVISSTTNGAIQVTELS